MPDEIALSLEETNKLRASLGLKIIEETDSQDSARHDGNENRESELVRHSPSKEDANFIDNDKVYMLRRKLEALKSKGDFNRSNDHESSKEDWLSGIGTKPVTISFNEEEGEDEVTEDLPLMRVSHSVSDLARGKDMILTLKESSVLADDDDDDALENEELIHDRNEAKSIQLKQMNKDRRRTKRKIQVSSADVEEEEKIDDNGEMLVIGATTNYVTDRKSAEASHSVGKLKISFDNYDAEDSNGGDFKPVQIKKRKKIGSGGRKKAKSIVLPDQIKKVELEDHDLNAELEDDLFSELKSAKRSKLRSQDVTPEELASQIAKEKREREQRAASIARSSNNLVVDESTAFLDSLKSSVLEEDGNKALEDESTIPPVVANEPPTTFPSEHTTPNFYDGLASTLNFVRERNVLPKLQSIPSSSAKPSAPDYRKEAQQIRERAESEMAENKSRYTTRDQEEVERYQDDQVARHINKLQSQRLQNYNPEISLVYKDDKGNQLTTREAYKKLSQKFHGTKSNQKKQAKAQSKIEKRKARSPDSSIFDVL